jgi:PAS domain S-box-containing protein
MSLVLVVYEKEAEQSAIEELLAARGHTVVKAGNGLEALDIVRKERPDAALSDVLLPRMDGFALCRKWKQDDRLQAAPFVFYTTRYDDPKYERFAQEVGADRFFANPESAEEVVAALDQAIAATRRGTGTLRIKAEEVVAAFTREKERELEDERSRHADVSREQHKTIVGLHAKIAELDGARQRHATSEAAYRSLFDAAPEPMWIQDLDNDTFLAVNEAMTSRYGYGRAELLGLATAILQPGDDRPVTATLDRPSPRRHRRKDQACLEVELHAREVPWYGKRALLVVAHDVTDRLRVLRALAEREEVHRRMVLGMPDAVLLVDGKGRVTEVNDAACTLTGSRREELLGLQLEDLLPGAGADAGPSAWRADRLRPKDRGELEVECHVAPLAGDRNRRMVVLRDASAATTDRHESERVHALEQRIAGAHEIGDATDEADALRRIAADACGLTGSNLGYVHLLDRPKGALKLAAWFDALRDTGAAVDGEPRSPARAGIWGQSVASRTTVLVNDPSPKSQPDGLPELGRCVAVPVLEGDTVIAVVGVANRDSDYPEMECAALERYVRVAGTALARRRREAHLAQRVDELIAAHESAVETLGAIAARLDPRGPAHARRVAALASAIGRELGLPDTRVELLQTAGLLHDLGMSVVPAGLLAAPRNLDAEERTLLARHPQAGADLLERAFAGSPTAEIIRQHHERLDGSGYPRGLSGEAIDLEARVLAVADTVCALNEHRPHRGALAIDAALAEVEKQAGRCFDPHVVAACVRLFRQHDFELPG